MSQEKKLTERTLTGFLWMITGSGVQVVLKIGVLAVLARLVGPKEFGIMGIAVIVVEFSKMFTQMGVGPAIVQRKELEDRHLTTGFTLSLFMGFFFAGMLALLAPLLEVFFRMEGLTPVLRVTALIFLVDSLTLIGQALLQRNMKFRAIAAVDVASYAIGYGGIGITLAYFGWGVWALVAAHMAQAILHAVIIFFIQPFSKRPGFELDAFKELLHFGGGMTMARIGNFLANQGDNLVVGRMLGAGALGIYGRAHHFMVMPASLFGTALDKALFPAMAKVQDDKQRLGKAYLTGVSIIATISIPLSIVLVLLAPEIIMVLLGPKWTAVILPFQILTCSLLFRMSYKMSDSLARATGAVYKRAWRQVIYAVLVVAGTYIGQFWGLPGVAVGVAMALITNFLLMAQLSLGITHVSWLKMAQVHWHGLVLGLTIGIASYTLVTLCRLHLHSHFLTLLVTGVALGILLALAIWRFPGLISHELKELFNKLVLKRIKKLPTQNAWTS
ncbi:lipopolysaccharide biosynthesis protein [Botryobacter ruber]|uniref:lipopolysaccharide biosynthesis protein n=1 Tax=Botryobacter ruber TaxID=2171629 RepID=UPI000E0C63F0|nr:lipopolysaccharide biosynthesis protein [Botryobacter ruber]